MTGDSMIRDQKMGLEDGTRRRGKPMSRGFVSAVTLALAVMAVVGLAACASAPPVPEDMFYRLQAVPARAAFAQPVFKGVLEVERFSADGLTAGRPIVYSDRDNPNQLREYHYHFWTQSPTIMLRDELVNYLRALKVADRVVTPEVRALPNHVLTARIKRLERVIGKPAATLLEVEIAVRAEATDKLEFLETYRAETAPRGTGMIDVVEALNEGLSIIFADFIAGLEKR